MNNSPIGIYDSGFGGLSVWRELYRALPDESLIYLGDGKNCPYGELDEAAIRNHARNAVECLLAHGCKMIVVACNTATAAAITYLREQYSEVPIVGLEPAVKPACKLSKSRKIAVLATEHLLHSEKFHNTVKQYSEDVEVLSIVGQGFVEAVEAGMENSAETQQMVADVVMPVINQGVDVIVLGCTHYPFLKRVIRSVIGSREIAIIDSGEPVEKRVESLLDRYDMRADDEHESRYEFLTFATDEYRERLRQKAFGWEL